MSIITLTTDFGNKDHYVALVKAVFLKNNPNQQIIDINHHIRPFSIEQAAFTVKHCYKEFPKNSIHIITVNGEPKIDLNNQKDNYVPCIAKHKDHFFILNDNGLISLLFGINGPEELYKIEELSAPKFMIFPTKTIYAQTAVKLLNGVPIDEIAVKKETFNVVLPKSVVVKENYISGIILHIDYYGNLISNITKNDFYKVGKSNNFIIKLKDTNIYEINKINYAYNEVLDAEIVALFNHFGYLEIALNKGVEGRGGGAYSLLGMMVDDSIIVEFYPQGSRQNLKSLF